MTSLLLPPREVPLESLLESFSNQTHIDELRVCLDFIDSNEEFAVIFNSLLNRQVTVSKFVVFRQSPLTPLFPFSCTLVSSGLAQFVAKARVASLDFSGLCSGAISSTPALCPFSFFFSSLYHFKPVVSNLKSISLKGAVFPTTTAVSSFVDLLLSLHSLQYLSLVSCNLLPAFIPIFSRFFRSSSCLIALDFSNNPRFSLSFNNSHAFSSSTIVLSSLNLSGTRIETGFYESLVENTMFHSNLKELDVSNFLVTDLGILNLSKFVSLSNLSKLVLKSVGLTNIHCSLLGRAINEVKTVEYLDVSDNSQIDGDGCASLIDGNDCLISLNLSATNVGKAFDLFVDLLVNSKLSNLIANDCSFLNSATESFIKVLGFLETLSLDCSIVEPDLFFSIFERVTSSPLKNLSLKNIQSVFNFSAEKVYSMFESLFNSYKELKSLDLSGTFTTHNSMILLLNQNFLNLCKKNNQMEQLFLIEGSNTFDLLSSSELFSPPEPPSFFFIVLFRSFNVTSLRTYYF
ncbi:hypothetical protein RCL1_004518 [Eukaryota sp. TZLM3-RCL]